jgi:hypothetical protein
MELVGPLEPTTSWVRASALPEPKPQWLSGFDARLPSPQHLQNSSASGRDSREA